MVSHIGRRMSVGASVAVVSCLSLALSACSSGARPPGDGAPNAESATGSSGSLFPDLHGQQLTVVGFGGDPQKAQIAALVTPFAEKTGVKIIQDSPSAAPKIQAMVQAKKITWDTVNIDPTFTAQNCGSFIEKQPELDRSQIIPGFDYNDCSVPVGTVAFILVYNKKKYGANPPTSWADYFDLQKFPGSRGVFSNIVDSPLEIGLLGSGVPADQLYPLDIQRSIAKWQTVKKSLVVYQSNSEGQDQLVTGSVDMSIIVHARLIAANKQGADYGAVWTNNIQQNAEWDIVKGTPNLLAARALSRYMLSPTAQQANAVGVNFGPILKGVTVPDYADAANNPGNHRDSVVYWDAKYWSTHYAEGVQTWTDFLAG